MMNDNERLVNHRNQEFIEKSMYAICVEEEENRKFIVIFFVIALLLLIFIVVGFSYSLFNGFVTGPVTPITPSSKIVLNYSDVVAGSEGIMIKNATAISDTAGKKLVGKGNVFDFSVSGSIGDDDIKVKYYIVLEKNDDSSLKDEDVKVYLTSRNGVSEKELMRSVPTVSSLRTKRIDGKDYRVLYTKILSEDESFNDEYSLRMWIKQDAEEYYGKKYSLKVNVFAEGVSEDDDD